MSFDSSAPAVAMQAAHSPSMGGSLPLHEFGSRLSAPIVILPLANHDDNQHAENENVRFGNLWEAVRIYGAVVAGFGAAASPPRAR